MDKLITNLQQTTVLARDSYYMMSIINQFREKAPDLCINYLFARKFEKVIFYFFSQNTRIDAGDYAQAWRSEVPHEHPADPPGGISGAGGVVGKAEIPGKAARRV